MNTPQFLVYFRPGTGAVSTLGTVELHMIVEKKQKIYQTRKWAAWDQRFDTRIERIPIDSQRLIVLNSEAAARVVYLDAVQIAEAGRSEIREYEQTRARLVRKVEADILQLMKGE